MPFIGAIEQQAQASAPFAGDFRARFEEITGQMVRFVSNGDTTTQNFVGIQSLAEVVDIAPGAPNFGFPPYTVDVRIEIAFDPALTVTGFPPAAGDWVFTSTAPNTWEAFLAAGDSGFNIAINNDPPAVTVDPPGGTWVNTTAPLQTTYDFPITLTILEPSSDQNNANNTATTNVTVNVFP